MFKIKTDNIECISCVYLAIFFYEPMLLFNCEIIIFHVNYVKKILNQNWN